MAQVTEREMTPKQEAEAAYLRGEIGKLGFACRMLRLGFHPERIQEWAKELDARKASSP